MVNIDTSSTARQTLLATTEALIYAGGINATGMDAIVKASGVARKTIYRHFTTKDALVAQALRERDVRWMHWFSEETCHAAPGPARLLASFDALTQWFATPDFRGCAFINAAGEIGDPADPIRMVAREHKANLRTFLLHLASEAAVTQPEALADAWLILIDGAISVAMVTGDLQAATRAQAMARCLLPSFFAPTTKEPS